MAAGLPVDKEPKIGKQASIARGEKTADQRLAIDDLYQKLNSEMRRAKPTQDAMAAALEVVHKLAGDIDTEDAVEGAAEDLSTTMSGRPCPGCGYRNREGNRFCAMCGVPVESAGSGTRGTKLQSEGQRLNLPHRRTDSVPDPDSLTSPSPASGTHHFHHHYHHHYFQAGQEPVTPRGGATDLAREPEKLRSPILRGESMSRAEAGVRRTTQEWVLACNTKHLDDLLELYTSDAIVLRSNYPPVRGAAAIREFFFAALDAGLGEVELEPLRVEVTGDLAYEAGRCKALIPGVGAKRREDRGKYLWVFARQSNGEWKLASDCWSSDLTLIPVEAEGAPAKPAVPRKGA